MSRRRVSVRDLGVVDCQGWLHRRKEGRSFLGSKWKRYWFVLKKSSLYWYINNTAMKADGFINLSGFTIEPAKQSRKKHAITASHPLVVTIFISAENVTDMNMWISKLSAAAETSGLLNSEECYSEDSDGEECVSTSCCLTSDQETAESESSVKDVPSSSSSQGDILRPLTESSPSTSSPPGEDRGGSSSEGGTLNRTRRGGRRKALDGGERLSWLDVPDGGAEGAASVPLLDIRDEGEDKEEEVVHENPPDEMESLYNHLKAASLSLIGRSSRRDFKASFIRRCQNDKINEKFHLLRILGSTLKAKESALLAVEQILTVILADPSLAAPAYRKWRLSNAILLQEIAQRNQAAGGAAELRPQHAVTPT